MHPACAADCTFLTDLASVVALIDELQSDCLKLVYDTYHFPLPARQRHVLAGLVPYIGIVHLGDRRVAPSIDQEHCPLGQGRVPLAEVVTTLLDAGYTGAFDVKLYGSDIRLNDYWMLLEQSQVLFAEWAHAAAPGSLA
jgi:sugar phosphate isomerase/epimerase